MVNRDEEDQHMRSPADDGYDSAGSDDIQSLGSADEGQISGEGGNEFIPVDDDDEDELLIQNVDGGNGRGMEFPPSPIDEDGPTGGFGSQNIGGLQAGSSSGVFLKGVGAQQTPGKGKKGGKMMMGKEKVALLDEQLLRRWENEIGDVMYGPPSAAPLAPIPAQPSSNAAAPPPGGSASAAPPPPATTAPEPNAPTVAPAEIDTSAPAAVPSAPTTTA